MTEELGNAAPPAVKKKLRTLKNSASRLSAFKFELIQANLSKPIISWIAADISKSRKKLLKSDRERQEWISKWNQQLESSNATERMSRSIKLAYGNICERNDLKSPSQREILAEDALVELFTRGDGKSRSAKDIAEMLVIKIFQVPSTSIRQDQPLDLPLTRKESFVAVAHYMFNIPPESARDFFDEIQRSRMTDGVLDLDKI
jgi:hypothetical protein